jgi:competence protein ComEC
LRPAVALISVGARNAYGHPAPATLAALRAAGARVLRTDRSGDVTVTADAAEAGAGRPVK